MNKLLLTVSFLFLLFAAFSQETKAEGTYTIEVLGRQKPLIPENIEQIVIENRKKDKDNYVSLGTHVRIHIFSTSKIEKEDFIPVKSNIVHVASFEKP